jgi:hypothetical protein
MTLWELIANYLLYIAGGLGIVIVLLLFVYFASGVQAKAWMQVFEKHFKDKTNIKTKENE